MRKFTIVAFMLLVALVVEAQTVIEGITVDIVEGDIIKVVSTEGDTVAVKFRNIECPEVEQDYGDEATAYTKKLSLKKKVTITYEALDRDRNLLGTVTLENGKDLGSELVKKGLAWHYMKGLNQGPNSQKYMDLEQEAREKNRGLWKDENPQSPWTFRNHKNKWMGKTSI